MKILPPLQLALALTAWSLADSARASGGWVGNSPLLAAFQPSIRSTASSLEKNDPDPFFNEEHNSLLLGEGISRLTIGFIYSGEHANLLGFDYGLSEDWTLKNFSTFAYNLRGRGGESHELALVFGMPGGLDYLSHSGFSIGPGVGLLHTYGTGRWRFTNLLSFSGVASFGDDPIWQSLDLRLRTGLTYSLGEKWILGFSSETRLGYAEGWSGCKVHACAPSLSARQRVKEFFFYRPQLTISRRISYHGMVTAGFGNVDGDRIEGGKTDGASLTLSTEW